MHLFARPGIPTNVWFSEISPYLTSRIRESYSYIDTETIPVSRVDGQVEIVGGTDLTAIVSVPTNIGPYTVNLLRESTEHPWLVSAVLPPEGW
ncbi:hypothetical protein [Lysinibacter sp. HNR]|uniref:hypothetical protein n=1 Tax=Lysinibacter sp. HNR TaxID=3031408 RepID=UPI002435058C|nr:hypothetical protein [Lysinibacter sp. HNR]WGD37582.1 hypothetical protein FrondiHNR_01260 [Lysinibacter sp. HNR]